MDIWKESHSVRLFGYFLVGHMCFLSFRQHCHALSMGINARYEKLWQRWWMLPFASYLLRFVGRDSLVFVDYTKKISFYCGSQEVSILLKPLGKKASWIWDPLDILWLNATFFYPQWLVLCHGIVWNVSKLESLFRSANSISRMSHHESEHQL